LYLRCSLNQHWVISAGLRLSISEQREVELVDMRSKFNKCMDLGHRKQKSKDPTVADKTTTCGSTFNGEGIRWMLLKVQMGWRFGLYNCACCSLLNESDDDDDDEDDLHGSSEYTEKIAKLDASSV
jgi:hypothetical protein